VPLLIWMPLLVYPFKEKSQKLKEKDQKKKEK
jgi:hypothetical protein